MSVPLWRTGAALALVCGLAACAHVEGRAEVVDHAPPGDALLLQNASRDTICYVSLGSADEDLRRAEDRLDADETLAPGQQHAFRLEPGPHRLRLTDCNRRLLLEQDVDVGERGATVTFRNR